MVIESSEILRSISGVLSAGISTGEKPSALGLPSRTQKSTAANRALASEVHVVLAAGGRKGRKGNAHDLHRLAVSGHRGAAAVGGLLLVGWALAAKER